jgi:LysM repeat protein
MLVVAAPAASAAYPHTVAAGESLYSVAAADGISVAQLAAANGVSADSQLTTGSTLYIPPQSGSSYAAATPTATTTTATGSTGATGDGDADSDDAASGSATTVYASSTSSAAGAGGGYLVQPGDTLSAIAARAGVSVGSLAAANGLDPNGILPAGVLLSISGAGATTSTALPVSTSAASSQPVGTAAQGSVTNPPYPTPETVSASEVGQIAADNGVSPSLAAAIGWQESGFNNDLVSSADARGVMQILPGTWDWINRTLTAGTPLAPASAASNVRGGVLLLHSLLAATGGDPAMAAAGYYQGLPSVQAHGLYSDTQAYVNSVMALRSRFGGP